MRITFGTGLRLGWLFAGLFVVGCGAEEMAGPLPDPTTPAGPQQPPPVPQVYQFGAKFEPPVGRVVHGMGQWVNYNPKYTALLPAANQPGSELVFFDIGDTPRGWEPAEIAARVAGIGASGRIPSLDISLRGLQPSPDSLAKLEDKLYGIDHLVAAGDPKYLARIQDVIQLLKAYGRPAMLRIGGEFSGPWNGYHPYEYPKAFRRIVTMFRDAGVQNVAFVWCYEPAAPNDFDAVNAAGQAKWYPGADVIDWFSIDLFAKADVSGATTGHDGGITSYGKTLRFLDMAVTVGRPVVIAESSPSHYDFGVTSQASAAWTEWFTPYFGLIAFRSEIKWFHYINYDWSKASYYLASGWKNNDLSASASLSALYVAELAKSKYLHADENALLKDYTKYP